MSKNFAGTGVLMKFIIRRNRIRLPVWIFAITIFVLGTAVLLPDLYPAEADKIVLAETMKNPAITFMLGYSKGYSNYTDGAIMGHFMLVFTAIFAAIMSILHVNKHTSEDEEEGRIELINSLPVGSLSNLSATIIVLFFVYIIVSLLIGLGLISLGIETLDLQGSLLFGASIGAVGVFYGALTGFFAQITSNTRATIGFSFTFLILEYIIRGIGDIKSNILSYISPLGLVVKSEVYVNNYWWPVLILALVSAIMFMISLYLNSIRDLASGFLPTKQGRKKASRFLTSPLGLALRLQRTSIISWIVGMFIVGVSYGSLLGDLEGFLKNSELIQQMIPEVDGMSLTDRFVTMLITIISVIGTIPGLMFLLKLRAEEKKTRTSQLLSTSVSRNRLLGSYTIIGFVAIPIIQFASIWGLWTAAGFVMEDVVSFDMLFEAAFVNIPAMWVFLGLAILLIGWLPRLSSLTWGYLVYSFFIEYLGPMLKLPDYLLKISPFAHTPNIPADELDISVLVIMAIIVLILAVVGFIGYNRRDIEG